MNDIAWPIAFAFVGFCFAVALANIFWPKDAQTACIEQRGKWVPAWNIHRSVCDFSQTAIKQ